VAQSRLYDYATKVQKLFETTKHFRNYFQEKSHNRALGFAALPTGRKTVPVVRFDNPGLLRDKAGLLRNKGGLFVC
jgi:hypothetical protein